jgi:hypothetical protein
VVDALPGQDDERRLVGMPTKKLTGFETQYTFRSVGLNSRRDKPGFDSIVRELALDVAGVISELGEVGISPAVADIASEISLQMSPEFSDHLQNHLIRVARVSGPGFYGLEETAVVNEHGRTRKGAICGGILVGAHFTNSYQ